MEKDQDNLKQLNNNKEQKKTKFQQLNQNLDIQLRKKWQSQQLKVKKLVIQKDDFKWDVKTLKFVAGVDLSAAKENPDIAFAGLVIYDIQKDAIVYEDYQLIQISQPYVPGFLAFRQIPSLYQLFMRLKDKAKQLWPQLILVDGNGILHPNQCGLGCHLGVLLDTPTVGVGKTLFYIDGLDKKKVKEQCEKQILKQGDFSILVGESGKKWGAGLRMTSDSKNPVFISIGHRITLQTAIQCVLKVSKYRVPEPIRLADKKTRQLIQAEKDKIHNQLKKYQMIYL